jgi:hypothetical protein
VKSSTLQKNDTSCDHKNGLNGLNKIIHDLWRITKLNIYTTIKFMRAISSNWKKYS